MEVSEDAVESREFSNLICGSEKVTVIDEGKPRRWNVRNRADGRLKML